MKIAACHALADLAKQEVPEEVARAYGVDHFKFGREYIIPKPFDSRILVWESSAVAKAAMETGVAQKPVDIEEYKRILSNRIGKGRVIMSGMHEKARKSPKRIVFPEGNSKRILRAANNVLNEGIAKPIVLGDPEEIKIVAKENEIELDGIQIINPVTSEKRAVYAQRFHEMRRRKGVTADKAHFVMEDRTYFGIMMLEMGDCDAVLSGVTSEYPTTIRPALQIIRLQEGIKRVSGMFAMIQKDKVYMFADTTVNVNPTAEDLAEIAILSAKVARRFNIEPRIAMLSFSNFGSAPYPESEKVARATALVKQRSPELMVDGEIQADAAVMPDFVKRYFPFSSLTSEANVFVFPNLDAANIAYKLMQRIGGLVAVGPILMGLSKPVHILHPTLDVGQIVDMAAIAVVDAQK
jgi:malate dehydrogenase (oxaloacetate-decarboxylating)(NADP+)